MSLVHNTSTDSGVLWPKFWREHATGALNCSCELPIQRWTWL